LVYCTKCGAQNPDDAQVCVSCGQALYPTRYTRGRREAEMCFGLPAAWGTIILGLFIILLGLGFLIQQWFRIDIWPGFFLIFLGILILAGAAYRASRR
jgi:hypothetical protein